jgi:hypothetical protein
MTRMVAPTVPCAHLVLERLLVRVDHVRLEDAGDAVRVHRGVRQRADFAGDARDRRDAVDQVEIGASARNHVGQQSRKLGDIGHTLARIDRQARKIKAGGVKIG